MQAAGGSARLRCQLLAELHQRPEQKSLSAYNNSPRKRATPTATGVFLLKKSIKSLEGIIKCFNLKKELLRSASGVSIRKVLEFSKLKKGFLCLLD